MDEKDNALNTEDYGHDLATVQRLQRKHDGLERDLAALGQKVGDLCYGTYRSSSDISILEYKHD